MKSISGCNLW